MANEVNNGNQVILDMLKTLGLPTQDILEVAIVIRPNAVIAAHVTIALRKENIQEFTKTVKQTSYQFVQAGPDRIVTGKEEPVAQSEKLVMKVNRTLKPNKV